MAIGKSKLHEMLRRGLTINEVKVWLDAWDENQITQVLNHIKYDQLFYTGKDGRGRPLGWYSLATEAINPLKKAGTHYTLHDTGEFYESMDIIVRNNEVEIDADGRKVDERGEVTDLFEVFGSEIIKLNEQNFDLLINEIKKKYIQAARDVLSGN